MLLYNYEFQNNTHQQLMQRVDDKQFGRSGFVFDCVNVILEFYQTHNFRHRHTPSYHQNTKTTNQF